MTTTIMVLVARTFVLISLGGAALSSLFSYPHELAYFNEMAGGAAKGHAHLLGSNLDWGQDLLFLRDWQRSSPNRCIIRLACVSHYDPADLGIRLTPRVESGLPSDFRCNECWCVISKNFLFPNGMPSGAIGDLRPYCPIASSTPDVLIEPIGATLLALKIISRPERKQ